MLSLRDEYKKNLLRALLASLIMVVILVVVYSLRNVALTTHDDLGAYLKIKSLTFSDFMSDTITKMLERGRISPIQVLGNMLQYVVYSSSSQFLYVLLMYIPILINVIFFGYIAGKKINKYLGVLIPLIFFTFIQIDRNHNLMIAYPLLFQLGLTTFLIGLYTFIQYQTKRKERYLWISALCMFDSFSAYESFVTYFAVFFLLSVIYNTSFADKKLHFGFKDFFKQIKYHLIAVFLYFAIYLSFRFFGQFNYGGATIDPASFNLGLAFKTLFRFSFSLFPIREFFQDGYYTAFTWSQVGIRLIVKAVAATAALCIILIKSSKIDLRKLIIITVVSFVAAVVFCIPHSLTPQYQNWVSLGVSGFAPSYFCYYWIVFPLSAIGIYISNAFKKLKPVVIILLCLVIFFGSIATDFTNGATIAEKQRDTVRYKMFDRLVASPYYASLEDGAAIYVEGYVGIHMQLSTLGDYGRIYSSKNYHYSNDISDVMAYKDKYFLWYDQATESIYLAKMKEAGIGDEVFAMSYSDSQP